MSTNSISLEEFEAYVRRPYSRWERAWRWLREAPVDALWWVKWRVCPRHRYNVVRTGLRPGYYDPCTVLICGIYETVSKYVREGAPEFDWTHDEEHVRVLALYTEAADWWRANRERFLDDFCGAAEKDYEKDEEAYRHTIELAARVVQASGHMWYA